MSGRRGFMLQVYAKKSHATEAQESRRIQYLHARHPSTVRGLLEKSTCNFSHWISTDVVLHKDTVDDLLHQLFFTQAALQLSPGQEIWDALIPIYTGVPTDEPFDG